MGSTVPRPLIRPIAIAIAAAVSSAAQAQDKPPGDSRGLTLNEAVARALERHPRLDAFDLDIRAAEARRVQAALIPNPELTFEAEEIRFGDGPGSTTTVRDPGGTVIERAITGVDNAGFGETEFTLSLSQRIELGGKRARRVGLADEAARVAQWDYEVARADVILEVRRAFIAVLVAQERLHVRQRLADLAQQAYDTVNALVEGGKITPLQANRARVERAQARIQLNTARRALDAARYRLAAQWGDQQPDFQTVPGDLFQTAPTPGLSDLERRILDSPDLARWTAEIARRQAAVELEQARRVPDLTVALGWRANTLPDSRTSVFDPANSLASTAQSQPDDSLSNSLILGFSIPLPLFDRNQGNIREAEYRLSKGAHQRRDVYLTIYGLLAGLHEELTALRSEVDALAQQIIPTAEQTYEATQLGFRQGKFPFLDVLDTQRTLFEVRNQYVEALGAYHRAVADMERFIGDSLGTPAPRNSPNGESPGTKVE